MNRATDMLSVREISGLPCKRGSQSASSQPRLNCDLTGKLTCVVVDPALPAITYKEGR